MAALADEAYEEGENLGLESHLRWEALPLATRLNIARQSIVVVRDAMESGKLTPIVYSALAPHFKRYRDNLYTDPPLVSPLWVAGNPYCLGSWLTLAHQLGKTAEIEAIFKPHGFNTYEGKKNNHVFTMTSFSGARFIE